jgi:hypothetical protein
MEIALGGYLRPLGTAVVGCYGVMESVMGCYGVGPRQDINITRNQFQL